MDSESPDSRSKRSKIDRNGRFAALKRLKDLKTKGAKHKYEVSDVDNVYETVDEKEYSKTVLERQEDDWIVDDDGSGYIETGRDIFDDDDYGVDSAAANSKSHSSRKRKRNVSKHSGKGDIQALLSSMPEKKKEVVNLDQDEILSDLLSGISENDKPTHNEDKKKIQLDFEEKRAAIDYMKNFSSSKFKKAESIFSSSDKKAESTIDEADLELRTKKEVIKTKNENMMEIDIQIDKPKQKTENVINKEETYNDDIFDDFDMTGDLKEEELKDEKLPQVEKIDEKPNSTKGKKKFDCADLDTDQDLLREMFSSNWDDENKETADLKMDPSEIPLVLNKDNKKVFRFYWWDAYEDVVSQPGVVFLLGKVFVESANTYASCCVAVRNIERKIFVLPRSHLHSNGFPTKVEVKMNNVFDEIRNYLEKLLKVSTFRSKVVKKKYPFEKDIPEESEYLEVRYSANKPSLNLQNGQTFSHVFGVNTSFIEICLLDCKIKGPCWLEIVDPELVKNPLSWCKFEVNCTKLNLLSVVPDSISIPPPPLTVATLNFKTILNKKLQPEIVMIGCLVNSKYHVDKPPPSPLFEQHFCAYSKLPNKSLPLDYHEKLKNFKLVKVQKCDSERALLNYFLTQFNNIDPDLVLSHDLQDYSIPVLSSRLEQMKATNWSRIGKIRRTIIPKKGRNLILGRLVCDLKISCRELIKSRDYSFNTLCQTVLKLKDGDRYDFETHDIIRMFSDSELLFKFITFTMQDAVYMTKMMYELNIIPLTLQITNIAGNVMSRTLLGGRAERNEFLLLHAFMEKDYLVPDKRSMRLKFQEDPKAHHSKKKAAYSGGLVLDPKVGFYDKYILLMDFNSLYPSIIQEYNICFTTIPPTDDLENVSFKTNEESGILPTEIRKLVESRRQVKNMMANSDISKDQHMQYNIRQLALKLTANSMYGCLGFENSRFYAKHLASLITKKGREILMHTKDLVQNLGYEVIYGDTDSIMIHTKIDNYDQVFKIGSNIKQNINKFYQQIELDIDGVFKYLLLLKKKKYAAVTVTKKNGVLQYNEEHKGLDIVRRDWSKLASEVGKVVLSNILNDQSKDEKIENIQTHLLKIKDDLENNRVPPSLLVIHKQLTKDPENYADAKSQPHVQVAIRHNKKGKKPLKQGDVVPYVICDDGNNVSATMRAYHIDELKNSDTLKIDTNYYLANQIHPVISRLCEPMEGLDTHQIASTLGLEASSFKKLAETNNEMIDIKINVAYKYQNCEPFYFKCKKCKEDIWANDSNCNFLVKCSNAQCKVRPVDYINFIQNKLVLTCRSYIKKYYRYEFVCEDLSCGQKIQWCPQKLSERHPICTECHKGIMAPEYSESELYKQLCYFKHMFNLNRFEKKPSLDKDVEQGFSVLERTANSFLNQCGYSTVDFKSLTQFFE